MISLGLRLVFIIPSLLYVVSFIFNCVYQCRFSKIVLSEKGISTKKKLFFINENGDSFFAILAIQSGFIVLANSLLLMYQFNFIEIGIIVLILGFLLSIATFVGLTVENKKIYYYSLSILSFIIGIELTYFIFVEIIIDKILYAGFIIDVILFVSIIGGCVFAILFSIILLYGLIQPVQEEWEKI